MKIAVWCWRKEDKRDKTKLVCHVFNCNGITKRLPTLYKGGSTHHEKVNISRKYFVFWTIMFAVFLNFIVYFFPHFHFIWLFFIVFYYLLAKIAIWYFSSGQIVCSVFLVIYLSSPVFCFQIKSNWFSMHAWFAFLFGCTWVHLCVRLLAKQTI